MVASRVVTTSRTAGTILGLSLMFLLSQTEVAFGGMWSAPWKRADSSWKATETSKIAGDVAEQPDVADSGTAAAPTGIEASDVPKLFWLDCGLEYNCGNAALYHADPAVATPVKTLFASGVFMEPEECAIQTGNIDPTTYQMTNMKTAYLGYARNGRLWGLDTTTLIVRQVSTETGFTANNFCELRTLTDFQEPANTTFFYKLRGPDASCWTGDDVRRAVKLGMLPNDAPINLPTREVLELLFDGTFVTLNWAVSPSRIEICQPNLTTCSPITTFVSNVWVEDYDATRFIFQVDGRLRIYNYVSGTMTNLFTPTASERISGQALDRDGFVYFSTFRVLSPYTETVRRVPVGGGAVTTLYTRTATQPFMGEGGFRFELTPTHLIYQYPNAQFNGMVVYAIPKAGGTAVLLTNSLINGGAVGEHLISETNTGRIEKINIATGTVVTTKLAGQLMGATIAGSGDWHYGINPGTLRFFLKGLDSKIRSYSMQDDFASPTAGVLLGTLPINLSNPWAFEWGVDMLGMAGKRNMGLSFGNDVLFLRASTASSLTRLTNSNNGKMLISVEGN